MVVGDVAGNTLKLTVSLVLWLPYTESAKLRAGACWLGSCEQLLQRALPLSVPLFVTPCLRSLCPGPR
jgi:hypothetical protein